jgi:transcriptional regulator with GAF, ATPase, and Fis domain
MLLDVYLVRDPDYSTVTVFTSEVRAKNFVNLNKKTELERIVVNVPYAATDPRRVISLEKQVKAEQKVKTLDETVKDHISYVLFEVCEGNIAKAARTLDMSDTNLRHKLKQFGLK